MKENPTIIFRVTNNCNLDCKYCYDKKNHSNIYNEDEIIRNNLDAILEYIKRIWKSDFKESTLIFHGGEPLLIKADTYRLLMEEILYKYPNTNFSIQTNGTLLSKEHIEIFKRYKVNIGISLDGCNAEQNKFRIYPSGINSFEKVMEKINLIKKSNAKFGIIITLTKAMLGKEEELYDFIADNKLRCNIRPAFLNDNTLEDFALTNNEYLEFFKKFFRIWLDDTNRVDLTQINEIYEEFAKCLDSKIGCGNCTTSGECFGKFISLDVFGNVYSCNRTYGNDYFYYGNIKDMTREELEYKSSMLNVERRKYLEEGDCSKCELYGECHGGCPANAYVLHSTLKSADDYFCMAKFEIKKYVQNELKKRNLFDEYNEIKKEEK